MEEAKPVQARQDLEQIGTADLLVGILDGGVDQAANAVAMVREAVGKLPGPLRTVVTGNAALPENAVPEAAVPDAAKHADGEAAPAAPQDTSFLVLPGPAVNGDAMSPAQSVSEGYRWILTLASKLNVRACCVIASNLQTVTPQWFYLLTQPVLEMGFDLVTPCYAHHVFEGLLNTSTISPLYQALYGQQVQNPLGPDLGFSRGALQRVLGNAKAKTMDHPLVSLAPAVMGAGLKTCQAYVGTRQYPPTDWTNASSLLAQILDPIFAEIEVNAAAWQRIRGSRAVPDFGEPEQAPGEDTGALDVPRMLESFHLGIRDLRDIWGLVLPPSSLFELAKLARLPQEQFRMPDLLWARIVYDFALGHRLRTISRDHLLRAMTPLYLGLVASYALELGPRGEAETGRVAGRLYPAFESAKPYFVSRWRWPDRFNP